MGSLSAWIGTWLLIFSCFVSAGYAETPALPQAGPYKVARGTQVKFSFPPVPSGRQIRLSWEARMDNPIHKGVSYKLDVELNGHEVGAIRSNRESRLLNKPVDFRHKKKTIYWYGQGGGWLIVHAPDFGIGRKLLGHSKDDYAFELDVTDLCRSDAPNELIFRHREVKGPDQLVLRNISVSYHPLPAATAGTAGLESLPAMPASDLHPLLNADVLGVQMGQRKIILSTRYSLPGGGWSELKGAAGASGDGGILSHRDFRVRRTAQWENGRLAVEETVTNLRKNRPLGLRIEHRLALGAMRVEETRLGGRPDPALKQFQSPSNPTLFAQLGAPAIGVALEDDAMRAQHDLVFEQNPDRLGWQSHQFALASDQSYIFRYSIYAVSKGDYFTFINLVRRDWGAPRRIDGPFVMMFDPDKTLAMKPEWLAAEIRRLGLKGFGSKGWHASDRTTPGQRDVGFGSGVLAPVFEQFAQSLGRAAKLIHKANPSVPVLFYSNMHRHSPETAEEAKSFSGEWVTLANGRRSIIPGKKDIKSSAGIIPSVDGAFGRRFRDAMEKLLQDLGCDGIYLDESRPNKTPWTYNRYDGVSGDLDPRTNEVVATKGASSILGLPYRLAFYQSMTDKGHFLFANGQPANMAENRLSFHRMVESHRAGYRAYESHLYMPLVYTLPNPPINVIRERLMMGTIPFRAEPGGESDVLKYFFPLTIAELGKGYIVGEERVVTAVSGAFRPTGPATRGSLMLFDANGRSAGSPQQVDLSRAVQINVPPRGLAVLMAERS